MNRFLSVCPDSAGVDVRVPEARFTVEVRPPAPLPPVRVDIEPAGQVDLDRLTPVSLNLKLCTPGRLRFTLSAGASWLVPVSFAATQTVRFFYFPVRTLAWTRVDDRPLSGAEQALAREIQRRLGPVEFSPSLFQATAGVAVRF